MKKAQSLFGQRRRAQFLSGTPVEGDPVFQHMGQATPFGGTEVEQITTGLVQPPGSALVSPAQHALRFAQVVGWRGRRGFPQLCGPHGGRVPQPVGGNAPDGRRETPWRPPGSRLSRSPNWRADSPRVSWPVAGTCVPSVGTGRGCGKAGRWRALLPVVQQLVEFNHGNGSPCYGTSCRDSNPDSIKPRRLGSPPKIRAGAQKRCPRLRQNCSIKLTPGCSIPLTLIRVKVLNYHDPRQDNEQKQPFASEESERLVRDDGLCDLAVREKDG